MSVTAPGGCSFGKNKIRKFSNRWRCAQLLLPWPERYADHERTSSTAHLKISQGCCLGTNDTTDGIYHGPWPMRRDPLPTCSCSRPVSCATITGPLLIKACKLAAVCCSAPFDVGAVRLPPDAVKIQVSRLRFGVISRGGVKV